MKSFIEHLFENWSTVNDMGDIPMKDRHKFVYHVTTKARAKKILKSGLKPREKGRGNYDTGLEKYSLGKAFITSHRGVNFWINSLLTAIADRRGEHTEDQNYENIKVLKYPVANLSKSVRRDFEVDQYGTRDSNIGFRKGDLESGFEPARFARAYAINKPIK